jgi:hypothetical protein
MSRLVHFCPTLILNPWTLSFYTIASETIRRLVLLNLEIEEWRKNVVNTMASQTMIVSFFTVNSQSLQYDRNGP